MRIASGAYWSMTSAYLVCLPLPAAIGSVKTMRTSGGVGAPSSPEVKTFFPRSYSTCVLTSLSVSARHIGQRGSALDTHFAQPKTWPHAFEPYSASSSQQYTQQNVGAPPSSFSQVNAR